MQEPASVLFSIANGVVWLAGLRRFFLLPHATLTDKSHDRKVQTRLMKFALVVNVNAWLWSAVFHARDLPWTEKMDYFSATLGVLTSLVFLLTRVISTRCWWMYTQAATAFLVYHVHYLTFVKFDYGYNMNANLALGVFQFGLMFLWWMLERRKHDYLWKAPLIVLLLGSALSLELLDFPPFFFVFDAHSLWHLVTVPIAKFYVHFICQDAMRNSDGRQKSKKL